MRRALVACWLLVAYDAHAAAWSDLAVGPGSVATWSETGTTDSGPLYIRDSAKCDNTSSNADFTVWVATSAGAKLHEWVGPVGNGVSCAAGGSTCGSVVLDPGYYVFSPESPDAGTASASCYGSR